MVVWRICVPQSILRRLHRNSLVMQHGRVPVTKKMPSDVGNADSLCRGLERSKHLVGVNRTRSEAVQERPVILTRAPGLPPKLGQPLHILVCQENRTTTTVRFGSRTCFGLRPLPPKSRCGPSLSRASEGQAARLCESR